MPLLGRKQNHGRALRYQSVTKYSKNIKTHKVLRNHSEENVCKMEIYELARETDPLHIQWYRKEGDREVRGHDQLH